MECHQAMVIHAKAAKAHVVHVDLVVHVVHVAVQVLVLVVLMDVDHVVLLVDLHFQVIVDLTGLQTMDSMDLAVVLVVLVLVEVVHLDNVAMGSPQTIQYTIPVQVILVCQWVVALKAGNHNHQGLDLQDPWDSSCPVPLDHGVRTTVQLENLG